MKPQRLFFYLFVISISVYVFESCNKDYFYLESSAKLSFSTDTISFDTIFTTLGSSTKQLVIKNTYSKTLKISKIKLSNPNSPYKLNINGLASSQAEDIEIYPNDSLYLFVRVTIDPNNLNLPLVVNDSIEFELNGNKEYVKLIAWGRDVYLIDGKTFKTESLKNDKPYFIKDYLLVDTLETLTIPEDAHLYFSKNARLWVKGTLKVEGSLSKPVIFEGGRTEKMYTDVPGQWGGIYLMFGSKDNTVNHCIIKNSIIGIQVDTLVSNSKPSLVIQNSKIEHHSYAGILARGTSLQAYNCLISDCGEFAVALIYGGSYSFYHCTIGNYWARIRSTPSLIVNNYYSVSKDIKVNGVTLTEKIKIPLNLYNADFKSCIVYGNQVNEVIVDLIDGGSSNYMFTNCLLKTTVDAKITSAHLVDCVVNPVKFKFENPYEPEYNFELDTLSAAQNTAKIEVVYDFIQKLELDLKGYRRLQDNKPDIGALERKE